MHNDAHTRNASGPQSARRRTDWAKLFWMMKSSPLTVIGGAIIVLMLLLMVLSPWITPYDPNAIDLTARLLPPSAIHWFGTDEVGRDLFSRVWSEVSSQLLPVWWWWVSLAGWARCWDACLA